jgi:Arc/MetJ-type ribon-helix-helix transcriptional regulator
MPAMTLEVSSKVAQLIREKMATGHYSSEDELIAEALRTLEDSDEELRAIEAGLKSIDRGDEGSSLDDAFNRLRAKHQSLGEP